MPVHTADSPLDDVLDVLAVDGDFRLQDHLANWLPPNMKCRIVRSTAEAEDLLQHSRVKVLLCSDELEGETGLMFLARTHERWPMLQRILMASNLDADLMIHAMREVSVFHYLPKPVDVPSLKHLIEHLLRQHGVMERLMKTEHDLDEAQIANARLASDQGTLRRIVQEGPQLIRMVSGIILAAVTVLILSLSILYFFKSAMGIDLMPSRHLRDLMPW